MTGAETIDEMQRAVEDARCMLMAAVYSSGQEIEVTRRALEVLPELTITAHEDPATGSLILRTTLASTAP